MYRPYRAAEVLSEFRTSRSPTSWQNSALTETPP